MTTTARPSDREPSRTVQPRRAPDGDGATGSCDRIVVVLMVAVPAILVLLLVWLPAFGSVALSFGTWNGIGGLDRIQWVGFQNYHDIATIYPPFWPGHAAQPDLARLPLPVPHAAGHPARRGPGPRDEGSRFYQTAFYLPVVLSLALIGFIWQLFYSRDQGLLNDVFHTQVDWYGDPRSTSGRCSSPPPGGTPATSCCSTWPA